MAFIGRTRELGALRRSLDSRLASVVPVVGARGMGKSALVARVIDDYAHVAVEAPSLPETTQRELLASSVGDAVRRFGTAAPAVAGGWEGALAPLIDAARRSRGPLAFVVDDAHVLAGHTRWVRALRSTVDAARAREAPLHVVLVGAHDALPAGEWSDGVATEPIRCGPLPFRSAAPLLPGARPADKLRAYGIFGGVPRVLAALDPDTAVGTNLRRAVLTPGTLLNDFGGGWVEREVRKPARYYAVLHALGGTEVEWSALRKSVPDLASSGQIAPYVKRLEQLGLIESRTSLDADPGSRARRYAVVDPFIATWMGFVFARGTPLAGAEGRGPRVVPRGDLDRHARASFAKVCRQFMTSDAIELLGQAAREGGSLWGKGYDVPVSGILSGGSAFYGQCHATTPPPGALDELDAAVRKTRFGYGREHRIRLLFSTVDPPSELQRAIARRHDAYLVGISDLVGA